MARRNSSTTGSKSKKDKDGSSKSSSKNKDYNDKAKPSQVGNKIKDFFESIKQAIYRITLMQLRYKRTIILAIVLVFSLITAKKYLIKVLSPKKTKAIEYDVYGNPIYDGSLMDDNSGGTSNSVYGADTDNEQYRSGGELDGDSNIAAPASSSLDPDADMVDESDFHAKRRIVPVSSKAGGSTSIVITEDSNVEIQDTHSLLIFLSSKELTADKWMTGNSISKRYIKFNMYPIFIDLPGMGRASMYARPDEVSGSRGYYIFVHVFLKALSKIYGDRPMYFIGFHEAGEFITPLIVEKGIAESKAGNNEFLKKQFDELERVKMLFMGHDITQFNSLTPIKIDRFRIPHMWVMYSLKGTDLSNVPDQLVMKSLKKVRYLRNAKLYKSFAGPPLEALNKFVRELGFRGS